MLISFGKPGDYYIIERPWHVILGKIQRTNYLNKKQCIHGDVCNKTNNIWWCREPDNSLPTRNFRFRINQHDPSTVNWRLADYKQQTQTTGLIQYHVGYTFIISSLYGQDQQILLALHCFIPLSIIQYHPWNIRYCNNVIRIKCATSHGKYRPIEKHEPMKAYEKPKKYYIIFVNMR